MTRPKVHEWTWRGKLVAVSFAAWFTALGPVSSAQTTVITSGGGSSFPTGLTLPAGECIDWTGGPSLCSDAANVLAQRNSTSAQTFNLYGTFTDTSNYERLGISATAGSSFTLAALTAGTGGDNLNIILTPAGTGSVISANGFGIAAAGAGTQGMSASGSGTIIRGSPIYLQGSGGAWSSATFGSDIQGSKAKSLTDAAAAVAFTRIAVANNSYIGGELIWTATSTDATDYRSLQGKVQFAGVNKGGTVTCTINGVGTDILASSNANTLACTWTNVVSTTNCDLSVTCTDNTGGSQTMTINGRLDMPLTATATPQ